jgi:hypothetical protein
MIGINFYRKIIRELVFRPKELSENDARDILLMAMAHILRVYGVDDIAKICDERVENNAMWLNTSNILGKNKKGFEIATESMVKKA